MSKEIWQKMMMDNEEIRDYLSEPRLARVATIDDGKPHVAAVWYDYDGETISMTTAKTSKKIRNIQKNNNIAVIVDSTLGSYLSKGVIFEGKADLIDDEPHKKITKSMYERYLGSQALQHPMTKELLKVPRFIVQLKPERVISWDFTKLMAGEAFDSRRSVAWISTVPESKARGTVNEVYSALRASFGIVPNLHKALSLCPWAISAVYEYLSSFKTVPTALSQDMKFMIGLLTAKLNSSSYAMEANAAGLGFFGMPKEGIEAMVRDYRKAGLNAKNVELLKFVEKLTTGSSGMTKEDIAWLRKLAWSDEQIVEAVVVASFENALSRIPDALGVEKNDIAVLKKIMLSQQGLVPGGKICLECGSTARPDASFCSECGAKLTK